MISIDHAQLASLPGCEAAARAFFDNLLGQTHTPMAEQTAASSESWRTTGSLQLPAGYRGSFSPAEPVPVDLHTNSNEHLRSLARPLEGFVHPVKWVTRSPDKDRFFTTVPWANRVELMCSH